MQGDIIIGLLFEDRTTDMYHPTTMEQNLTAR